MSCLIFGCGFLGLPVAKRWVESGHRVHAVTRKVDRQEEFNQFGLHPVVADVTKIESLDSLPSADVVLVAVGMDRSVYSDVNEVYVNGLKNVLASLGDGVKHLIYVSSTGVYGNFDGEWVDEESPTDPQRPGGKACLVAEQLIRESKFGSRSTILRFAGIYGPGRVPTKATVQSRDWKKLTSAGYLNLIHVDDGAAIIDLVANSEPGGETFLVCDGNPVLRRDYYSFMAQCFGMEAIPWEATEVDPSKARSGSNKRISNRKLVDRFDVAFEYQDYRAGLKQSIGTVE